MNDIILTIAESPYFALLVTACFYALGCLIYNKTKFPLFNPFLLAIIFVIAFLLIFDIDYSYYEQSSDIITYFLTPATVCFAIPLYRQLKVLKENFAAIVISIFVGSVSCVGSIFIMSKIVSLPKEIYVGLAPKSVTTPIATGIVTELEGFVAVVLIAVILSGIFGAVLAIPLSKFFKFKTHVALGLATGTSSHAVGTSRVLPYSEVAGAMSSLSIVIAGIMTVVIVPVISASY